MLLVWGWELHLADSWGRLISADWELERVWFALVRGPRKRRRCFWKKCSCRVILTLASSQVPKANELLHLRAADGERIFRGIENL